MLFVVKETNVVIVFFLCNLRYISVEIKINQTGLVEKLQNFCRHNWKNFHSIQQLLHTLAKKKENE